ncbi:hypothetical protein B0H13DRAFT_1968835 [Mycena leptocephala]|nr:hypothetical protein B0H13DRAFT_1968835 [Mycena leptocephala]
MSISNAPSFLWPHERRFPVVSILSVPLLFDFVCVFYYLCFRLRRLHQCFAEIKNGSYGTTGGTDNQGIRANITTATSITYELCIRACGKEGRQFSAWLLPWLALLSQLPFGSRYKWDNLMSAILAWGALPSSYSRFANSKYPNSLHAIIILSSLQQTPLKVTTEGSLLASLVVLPENDAWWRELAEWLDYADIHTWTIAGATSVAWVVIAYALTIIDAFSTISTDPNSNGQGLSGVGSIWLWMIPLTIGYLQISPRCDAERVTNAINRANNISHVAGPNGTANADTINDMRALSFHLYRGSLHQIERAHPCRPTSEWEAGDGMTIHPANRRGQQPSRGVLQCSALVRRSNWGPDVFSRIFIASVAALALQWSTSGASILIVYFTPTVGLGCRSGAYLLYAAWHIDLGNSRHKQHDQPLAATYPEYPDLSQRIAASSAFSCAVSPSKRAHNVMQLTGTDISAMKAAWIGGVVLAVAVSSLYLSFINVFIDPPLPPHS